MSPNAAGQLFQIQSAFAIFKYGIAALLVLFFIFLLVVLKQIRTMNTIITERSLFAVLQLICYLLLAATIVVFILTLVLV